MDLTNVTPTNTMLHLSAVASGDSFMDLESRIWMKTDESDEANHLCVSLDDGYLGRLDNQSWALPVHIEATYTTTK